MKGLHGAGCGGWGVACERQYDAAREALSEKKAPTRDAAGP